MTTAAGVREFGHHPAKSQKYGENNKKYGKIILAPPFPRVPPGSTEVVHADSQVPT